MKRTKKKTLLISLAALGCVAATGCLTSCGKDENRMDTIYISVINKGYGTSWVESLIQKFIATNSNYSSYKYEIINSYDDETTKTSVESGSKYCNYDLVFHGGG